MSVLTVSNLGKAYRSYRSEWQRIARWFGFSTKPSEEQWVLRHISFSIQPGEAVGIVGKNGAGKSTLLKMITGTLQPTEGEVQVRGNIAAILELGMGFNPELTGRQNVYHAAGLMGFGAEQVALVVPEVEAFADIGEYFDEAVRTYSSGMQVRVAFAVATAFRPDILVVDEALSVGDAAFQRKCFRRIEEFREQGMSLLFVSHDIESIKKICDKAVFLKDGGFAGFGPAKTICDEYEKSLFGGLIGGKKASEREVRVDDSLASNCEMAYGDGRAVIESIWLQDRSGVRANVFGCLDDIVLRYRVRFNDSVPRAVFAFLVKAKDGVSLIGADSSETAWTEDRIFQAGETVVISFEIGNSMAPGVYYVNCGVRDEAGEELVFLHRRVDAVMFRIKSDKNTFAKAGLINVPVKFSFEANQ